MVCRDVFFPLVLKYRDAMGKLSLDDALALHKWHIIVRLKSYPLSFLL